MTSMKVVGILTAAVLAVPVVGLTSDWAEDLAKKAVGRVAREGIENALKDEALDATLNAAARGVEVYAESERRERYEHAEVAEVVGTGVEVAMRTADVAEALDAAADVAETVSKVNKIRKVVR